jgi:tetratricopeptide (TPR) repeat protein
MRSMKIPQYNPHPRTASSALVLILVCASSLCGQTPSREAADFRQAQQLAAQHEFYQARTSVIDGLKRNPGSVEGYNLLGIIESSLKDYPAALDAFSRALTLAPNSAKTHNNLGDLYLTVNQIPQAEKEFRTVLRLSPADPEGNYNLGVLLMGKGAPAEAIAHFERVHPQTTATQFNLVRAYFAVKRPADGRRLATKLSTLNPNNVRVHFSLGVLLASQHEYAAAEDELSKADALQPNTFEIVYNLGQALARDKQYAKAELTLNRALLLRPDSVDAMYQLAETYSDESRPLDALDLLVRAHKAAPENTDVIFLMARISMSQDYYEDAIPLLESGVQLAPGRTDLLAELGESYFMAGQIDRAIVQFNKLVALEHSARAYSFLGLAYRDLGRLDEAKQYFEKGLAVDPHNNSCLFNLGFIAERQGQPAIAENYFQKVLSANPDFPDALLELANMRIAARRNAEAKDLLQRFVRVSHFPATGYYKLAMVERTLHETDAADRDLKSFQTLSRDASTGPLPYEHLFEYLDSRSTMNPVARQRLDVNELINEVKRHPDQPQNLYLLAEAYLKSGDVENARATVAQLDQLSSEDYRSLTGTGVLLARYRLYDDAVTHFQRALALNPDSDDVKFNLANAWFHKRLYPQALEVAGTVSEQGKKDSAYLALLGDLDAHTGAYDAARTIFQHSIATYPDNDQGYLSLALLDLRQGDTSEARRVLQQGHMRIPDSGKLDWGLGLTSALEDDSTKAAEELEHAVDLLPQWSGGYSTLGVYYFQTGQVDKAREVLSRFKGSSARSSLDIERIEQVLDQASSSSSEAKPLTQEGKAQFLQLALSLADRTL